MALAYESTVNVTTLDGSSVSSIITGLKTILEAVGFTCTYTPMRALVGFGTSVTDGHTLKVDSITYRFKNTMAAAYDVKIGTTVADTCANFIKAINLAGTEGVEYYAGTALHPTVSAAACTSVNPPNDSTCLWLISKDATSLVGPVYYSSNTSPKFRTFGSPFQYPSNYNEDHSYNKYAGEGGGLICTSPAIPDGIVGGLRIYLAGFFGGTQRVAFAAYGSVVSMPQIWSDGGYSSGTLHPYMAASSGRTYQIIATPQKLLWRLTGDFDSTAATSGMFLIPDPKPGCEPIKIASVASSGGLIQVTTQTAHGLSTGNTAYADGIIIDGAFSSACNIQGTVTVSSDTVFTFDGSTFPSGGSHTANSGVCGLVGSQTITGAFVACNSMGGAVCVSPRTGPSWENATSAAKVAAMSYHINRDHVEIPTIAAYIPGAGFLVTSLLSKTGGYGPGSSVLWTNGIGNLLEAVLVCRPGGGSSDAKAIGIVPGMLLIQASATGDDAADPTDGHTWMCWTNSSPVGTLYIATGASA